MGGVYKAGVPLNVGVTSKVDVASKVGVASKVFVVRDALGLACHGPKHSFIYAQMVSDLSRKHICV